MPFSYVHSLYAQAYINMMLSKHRIHTCDKLHIYISLPKLQKTVLYVDMLSLHGSRLYTTETFFQTT